VFQLESKGMKDVIRKLKPSNINDIIALIALYRPGPMDLIDDFVNRKHGRTPIVYDHPLQEEILKETYGVSVYQEQAMKMTVTLAGFTGGEADTLRKAMSKKKFDIMAKMKDKFISGAKKVNDIDGKLSAKIFENIEKFAGYGFNKSHAAAYGAVSYRTAYLKAHYPLEYFTAMLNSQIGNTAKKGSDDPSLITYIEDAKDFGIEILPPDVQHSDGQFKTEGNAVRFGILAVKGVGSAVTDAIEQARASGGKFKNFDDFLQRIDSASINKRALESFAKAGVFDSFSTGKTVQSGAKDAFLQTRADILSSIDAAVDNAAKVKKEKESSQGFLFGETEPAIAASSVKESKPLEYLEALNYEKEVLEFYLSGHPLTPVKRDLIAYSNFRLDSLPQPKPDVNFKNAQTVRVAGMISMVSVKISKKKESYAKFKIEDLHGAADCVAFPKKYEEIKDCLEAGKTVVLKGLLMGTGDAPEIIVDEIMTIDEAKKRFPPNSGQVHIKLSTARYDDDLKKELSEIFEKHKGKAKVFFDLEDASHGSFLIETPFLCNCSDNFVAETEKAVGVKDSVELKYA
jgi:DNA polymerase-3 subunit alpha